MGTSDLDDIGANMSSVPDASTIPKSADAKGEVVSVEACLSGIASLGGERRQGDEAGTALKGPGTGVANKSKTGSARSKSTAGGRGKSTKVARKERDDSDTFKLREDDQLQHDVDTTNRFANLKKATTGATTSTSAKT